MRQIWKCFHEKTNYISPSFEDLSEGTRKASINSITEALEFSSSQRAQAVTENIEEHLK